MKAGRIFEDLYCSSMSSRYSSTFSCCSTLFYFSTRDIKRMHKYIFALLTPVCLMFAANMRCYSCPWVHYKWSRRSIFFNLHWLLDLKVKHIRWFTFMLKLETFDLVLPLHFAAGKYGFLACVPHSCILLARGRNVRNYTGCAVHRGQIKPEVHS